jgi:hypothetical protein
MYQGARPRFNPLCLPSYGEIAGSIQFRLCCIVQLLFTRATANTASSRVRVPSLPLSFLHLFNFELQQLKVQVELEAEFGQIPLPTRNPFPPSLHTHKQTRNQNRGVSSAQLPLQVRLTPLLQLGKVPRERTPFSVPPPAAAPLQHGCLAWRNTFLPSSLHNLTSYPIQAYRITF